MAEAERAGSRPPAASSAASHSGGAGLTVTPELVQKIADAVYALLRRDLMIESERARRRARLNR